MVFLLMSVIIYLLFLKYILWYTEQIFMKLSKKQPLLQDIAHSILFWLK